MRRLEDEALSPDPMLPGSIGPGLWWARSRAPAVKPRPNIPGCSVGKETTLAPFRVRHPVADRGYYSERFSTGFSGQPLFVYRVIRYAWFKGAFIGGMKL